VIRLVSFALTICALVSLARGDEEKNLCNPEEFTISYWAGPPPHFSSPQRYAEVKEANFTLAFPPSWGVTVEDNQRMLDYCQQAGIKAVIRDGRIPYAIGGSAEVKKQLDAVVADYANHPALLGYDIVDEPSPHVFPGLGEVVAYLREKDPKHITFVNLLPVYARDIPGNYIGAGSYEDYVRQYADVVKPFVLCYDNYPFLKTDRMNDFMENLATVRKVSIEKKLPFWNIVLVTQHGDYRVLTEGEMRFQAMQTLAFGARGLLWFTYWDPSGPPNPGEWSNAMIDPKGNRTPHWDMGKRINADVKAIGDALGRCDSVNVFHHGDGATIKPATPSPITPAEGEKARLTIGVFKSRDGGKTLALVTNRDYKQPTKPSLLVQPAEANVERFEPSTKTWSAGGRGTLSVDINEGGGILLRW
jgi:hypothetical protein